MPYRSRTGNFERARRTGHVPIVQNEMVREQLQTFRVFNPGTMTEIDSGLVVDSANLLPSQGGQLKWVMSFDGSPSEVAVREEYPSTRIGYVQVAGVLVNIEQLLTQSEEQLVDPTAIKNASREALHNMVLPGSNVCRTEMETVKDSWRLQIYEIFRDHNIEEMPLLEIFMIIVNHSDKISANGGVIVARCSASEDCDARNIDVPREGISCPTCDGYIYPTDALRIHEEVQEEHGNATSLGRLMVVIEQLTMVGYLHFLMERQPRILGKVAFIMDGPLAIFGPQAWLHVPILSFIHSVQQKLSENDLKWPVIVGIEKSGAFSEHLLAISHLIPKQSLMVLPDEYIYSHILTFRQTGSFGRDTYYGQKFFYKTAQDIQLTITIPKAEGNMRDPFLPDHYPYMRDTISLLDKIGTNLYEDAVIPVALAHSFASIPLRTGSRVLTLLSRELLGSSD